MTTQDELARVDALIRPPGPPERIHGWQNSQMSIARFSGGLTYNGHGYTIAYGEPGQPLVRDDVLKREAKAASEAKAEACKAAKQRAKDAQGGLI